MSSVDAVLRKPENRFSALPWRVLRWLDRGELESLEAFLEPVVLRRGTDVSPIDAPSPGLLFIVQGTVSVSTRLPSGIVAEEVLFGRDSVWGEDALDPKATVPMEIVAVRDTWGWMIRKERFAEAFARVPDLKLGIERLGHLRQAYVGFINALRADMRFATACIPALVALMEEADVHEVAPGEGICRAGEPLGGLRLLLKGTLQATTGAGERAHNEAIHQGMVFGGLFAAEDAIEPATVTALEPSTVVRIPMDVLRDRLSSSRGLRRVAQRIPALASAWQEATEVVAIVADSWPELVICEMLAQSMRELYQDDVAVLQLLPAGAKARPREVGPDGIARAAMVLPAAGRLDAFRRVVKDLHPAEFVFLDVSAVGYGVLAELEPAIARLNWLTRDTFAPCPVPYPQDKIRYTVNIGETRVDGEPAYQPGTVRVKLNRTTLARTKRRSELSAEDQERFGRWARGLSERTVGVALGGGGAWGFAHVTLLTAMREAGIPIDMIAGSSFGSICGAWYCGRPNESFDGLFKVMPAANRAVRGAVFSSASIEQFVTRDITPLKLEELEVPLFPVATDVGRSRVAVLTAGGVGFGVRASGSFPGIFGPTIRDGRRLVDGGIIRNVPIDPLVAQGADFIVASNIVPNPEHKHRPSKRRGRVRAFLDGLNPAGRFDDLFRSSLILMHTAGEAVAWTADVVYASDPVLIDPTDFRNAEKVAIAARPSVAREMPRISRRWAAVAAAGDRV